MVIAGGAVAGVRPAKAAVLPTPPADAVGLLYDATLCIGCKTCEVACNEANHLPADTRIAPGARYHEPPDLTARAKTVIKLYREGDEQSFFKAQCMHCVDPACTNACMLGALKKKEHGIVSYDSSLCVGCRYCQMACPFNVPKFEWAKAAPKIVKCELCRERAKGQPAVDGSGFTRYPKGQGPACAEVCPRAAVIAGTRAELLAEAKRRIAASPGRYKGYREGDEPKIFGETDGGGTQVLYLSHVAFEKLRLPNLSDQPVPEIQQTIQHGVYQGFAAPILLYGLLGAAVFRNRRRAGEDKPEKGNES
jgi:Fe-S-cluster-containing dehydrogenase component